MLIHTAAPSLGTVTISSPSIPTPSVLQPQIWYLRFPTLHLSCRVPPQRPTEPHYSPSPRLLMLAPCPRSPPTARTTNSSPLLPLINPHALASSPRTHFRAPNNPIYL